MNENDYFSNVQRLNSLVIARSEWASSRMSMQKSGEELRDRRHKTNCKANEFLQELLKKRSNSNLFDDNGAIDRYYRFLKNKRDFNHSDDDDVFNEFNRRLHALNSPQRRKQSTKIDQYNQKESISIELQTTNDIGINTKKIEQVR